MLPERALRVLAASEPIAAAEKLVVAVSGGCDSVALLHILVNLRATLAVELHVASLDHGLRGAAGQQDLAFVGDLADKWGLPHTLEQADVPQLAETWGMGVEAAARRVRYDFLARVARQECCSCVLTGHHADDQAETVLMNIVRGSGLRGLGGMRLESPLPYHPHIKLIRPLLTFTRAQLEQYCAARKLAWRRDESNWDTGYGRNYLRHEVMDKLARLNPDVVSALTRLADSAQTDEHYVAGQLGSLAKRALRSWDDGCSVSLALFREAHPTLQRRLLRHAFHQLAREGSDLTHERTLDLVAFCLTARAGARRDIGAGLELYLDYSEFRIQRIDGKEPPQHDFRLIPSDTDRVLRAGERLEFGGISLLVRAEPSHCEAGTALVLPAGCELRLRTRRPGDRFKPKGMGGRSRKLKDWMIDRKIPRRIRDRIPLLCADGAIVAICVGAAWRLADSDAPAGTETSTIVLCLD